MEIDSSFDEDSQIYNQSFGDQVPIKNQKYATESVPIKSQSMLISLPLEPKAAPINFNPNDFVFPPDQFQTIQWNSLEEIRQYLDRGVEKLGLHGIGKLYIQRTQFGHLLFKCKICSTRITFSRPQNYKLIRFQNKHKHEPKQLLQKNQDANIYAYLMQIPFSQGVFLNTQIKYMIKNKFDVSKDKAKLISQKFLKNYLDLDFIIEKVTNQNNVQFRKFYNDNQRQTSAVLMITSLMKNRYKKYGYNDCLCIDLKKRILTNVNENGKLWQTLILYGQDKNLNIVLFGICLIADRTCQMYTNILEYFFIMMDSMKPQCILTKQIDPLTQAIQILLHQIPQNQKWMHIYDWRSKLKKIRDLLIARKLTDDQITDFIQWFGSLLQEPSYKKFQALLHQNKVHKIDQDIIADFLKYKEKYCFCMFPKHFCGFVPATTRNDRYNTIIRQHFKPGKNFAKFFYDFFKYESQQIPIENIPIALKNLKRNRYEELKQLQFSMHPNIFQKMNENFSPIIQLQATRTSENTAIVTHGQFSQQLTYINQRWYCSCGYMQKIGLPCKHQLKIISGLPLQIKKCIHPRWLIETDKCKLENKKQENSDDQNHKCMVKRQDRMDIENFTRANEHRIINDNDFV